jgi:hypothetical protein
VRSSGPCRTYSERAITCENGTIHPTASIYRQLTFIELSFERFYLLVLLFSQVPKISPHLPLFRVFHSGNTNTERWLVLFELM